MPNTDSISGLCVCGHRETDHGTRFCRVKLEYGFCQCAGFTAALPPPAGAGHRDCDGGEMTAASNFGWYCPDCGTNHANTTAACTRAPRTNTAGDLPLGKAGRCQWAYAVPRPDNHHFCELEAGHEGEHVAGDFHWSSTPRPADREQGGASEQRLEPIEVDGDSLGPLMMHCNVCGLDDDELHFNDWYQHTTCQSRPNVSDIAAALKAPPPDTEPLRAREQFEQGLQQLMDAVVNRTNSRDGAKWDAYNAKVGELKLTLLSLFSRSTAPHHQDSVRLAKIRAEGAQFVVTGRDIYAAVPWPDGTRVIVAPLDWIDPNAAPNTTPAGGVDR